MDWAIRLDHTIQVRRQPKHTARPPGCGAAKCHCQFSAGDGRRCDGGLTLTRSRRQAMVAWGESQAHRDRIAIRYDCPSRPPPCRSRLSRIPTPTRKVPLTLRTTSGRLALPHFHHRRRRSQHRRLFSANYQALRVREGHPELDKKILEMSGFLFFLFLWVSRPGQQTGRPMLAALHVFPFSDL